MDKLCGFVWCHGEKDFSAWEVDLPDYIIERIEKILENYAMEGTSVRNVWDMKFNEVFTDIYLVDEDESHGVGKWN